MQVAILIAAILTITISLTAWLVGRLLSGQSGVVEDRLSAYTVHGKGADRERRQRRTMAAQLDQYLRKRSFGQNLAENLAKADLQYRVSEFMALCVISAVLGALAGLVVSGTPVLAVAAGVFGYFLPHIYIKRRQAARLKSFNDQLGDALRLIVSSLRSGYSMMQSMEVVGSELPDPIGTEFGRVVREVALGLSQEEAMHNILRRVPSDDLDMMVTAINVQHEVGGNLAEILDTITGTIAERVRIQGEIRVLTSQQMYSGYLLTGMPFAVSLFLYIINRKYMVQMVQDTCGIAMLALGLCMIAAGYVIIRRIVRIQV
jgi:tight adherence protein B